MRTALLVRIEDVSGSSGTGVVGEIVQFANGWCILFWLTEITSFKFFPTIEELDAVHSHEGRTRIVWRDEIRELQEALEEGDPLINMLRSIEDRRVAHKELLRGPDLGVPVNAHNEDITDDYERILRHSQEDLRSLHVRHASGAFDFHQFLFNLGTHIHEVDIALESLNEARKREELEDTCEAL